MTQGLYEQLGVGLTANATDLFTAYNHRASRIVERKNAISRKGGDYSKLDIDRDQLDNAYNILSDPKRRRLYDAMLTMTEGDWDTAPERIWETMRGAFATPKRRAAMELLNQLTKLNIPPLARAPQPFNHPGSSAGADTEGTEGGIDSAPFSFISHTAPINDSSLPTHQPAATEQPDDKFPSLRVLTDPPTEKPITEPDIISVIDITHNTAVEDPTDHGVDSTPNIDPSAALEKYGATGALLKALREASDLTLEDVSQQTNIKREHILNLEIEAVSELPHKIYVYGYSKNYAELYGLDGEMFATTYTARIYG
jgi:curved DNA-binding protein CbpA